MQIVLCSLLGYLIGNINAAYIISKLKGFDIRERGSGNAGASNVMMVIGKKEGAIAAVFDIIKAFIAASLGAKLFAEIKFARILAGSCCILGHIFPVLMHFHGGKGLACLAGVIIQFDPQIFLCMLLAEMIIGFSIDYICIVPITGSVMFTAIYAFLTGDMTGTLILAAVSMVILYKHIENIRRIQNGTEAHISFLWNKDRELERIKKNGQ
ncbi:MAG: glycerol-3-phosphate acyltransferase [Ruminococcus sp.]|nr:glycerol-3-phosphate acyltransferase [Ruminococcus sp.]